MDAKIDGVKLQSQLQTREINWSGADVLSRNYYVDLNSITSARTALFVKLQMFLMMQFVQVIG